VIDVYRTLEIGRDLAAIDTAIEHARVAWTNNFLDRTDFYSQSTVFTDLSTVREALRKELHAMEPVPTTSGVVPEADRG